jgi:Mce-associated membrane protein
MFRPRRTEGTATDADELSASVAVEPSATDETAEVEPTQVVSEAPEERPAGRRRWFRRGPKPAPAAEPAEVTEPAEVIATAEVTEPADPVAADESADPEQAEDVDQIATAPRKPAGKVLVAAVAAAAARFVATGALAGAMLQPYLADRALVDTKLNIARTAANAITTLWTYSPDNMDTLPDRSAKYLAGDFEDQYRKYIDAIAPLNKQAKVSNSTDVVGTAVESLNGKDATAVVYTNTTNVSPQSNNIPSLQYLSYRLTMERHGSQWLITKMTTVTSLNLSPKLG